VKQLKRDKCLDLNGVTHITGLAGSGKTILTSFIASQVVHDSYVHWVCTDNKYSFISYLKQNTPEDKMPNVHIEIPEDHEQARACILALRDKVTISDVSLVVIDSITRVIDMSHRDALLWGRELEDQVLPTLVALSKVHGIDVILTSESRLVKDKVVAVFAKQLSKWSDQEFVLKRDYLGKTVRICLGGEETPIAYMTRDSSGVVVVSENDKLREVTQDCSGVELSI
jgi:hypothetical protein